MLYIYIYNIYIYIYIYGFVALCRHVNVRTNRVLEPASTREGT